MAETTCLGAAIAAGNAKGVEVWDLDNIQPVPSDTFLPSISDDRQQIFSSYDAIYLKYFILERDIKYSRWKMAINRSLGWAQEEENDSFEGKILSS